MVRVVSCLLLLLVPSLALGVRDVRLVTREAAKPGSHALTASAVVEAPPLAVRHVVLHACEFKARYGYVKSCVVWEVAGPKAWQYQVMDLPVLSPRDYGIVRHVTSDLTAEGGGVLRVAFSTDPARGPASRPGMVRVRVNEGSYEVRPEDGGRSSRVEYQSMVAPGGYVPVWLVGLAARRAAPELFRQIESAARDVEKAGLAGTPVPGEPWREVRVGRLDVPMVR
jgi:hypothetical protein